MSARASFYGRAGKRVLDVGATVLSAPLLLPLALLVALVVRLHLGAPVLFRQTRIGKGGRPFTLAKFRTMRILMGPDGKPAPDDARLTRLGSFLRRSSLDELPELALVLSGRMSLVGPRPLLPEYLSRYTPRQARRHEVLPGLTGLAQIRGRNSLSWKEKLELDVQYVERLSFALDLSILVETIWAVVRGQGITAAGHPSMPEFLGTEETSDHNDSRPDR